MENVHRSNTNTENKFVEFFEGLDESYQRHLIAEMEKKPPGSNSNIKPIRRKVKVILNIDSCR